MNTRTLLFIPLLSLSVTLSAQQRRAGLLVSNQTVSFPVTGMPSAFYAALHPGIDVYAEQKINKREKNQLHLQINLGVMYHRFFQTAVRLYPWLEYRYTPQGPWRFNAGLGLGYQHAFPAYDILRQSQSGEWVSVPSLRGRPQFMAGLGLGVSRAVKKSEPDGMRLEFRLRTNIQAPFAKSYIPVIPYHAAMLGLSMPLPLKGGKS